MKNRFKVSYVPNRPVQDEVAAHLEDTLNAFNAQGYAIHVEERDGGGYMVHGEIPPPEEVEDDDTDMPPGVLVTSKAVLLVMADMTEITNEAAKKEVPDIIRKMVKPLSVESLKEMAKDFKTFSEVHAKMCPVKNCTICAICDTAVETMKVQAELNLS